MEVGLRACLSMKLQVFQVSTHFPEVSGKRVLLVSDFPVEQICQSASNRYGWHVCNEDIAMAAIV